MLASKFVAKNNAKAVLWEAETLPTQLCLATAHLIMSQFVAEMESLILPPVWPSKSTLDIN